MDSNGFIKRLLDYVHVGEAIIWFEDVLNVHLGGLKGVLCKVATHLT